MVWPVQIKFVFLYERILYEALIFVVHRKVALSRQ